MCVCVCVCVWGSDVRNDRLVYHVRGEHLDSAGSWHPARCDADKNDYFNFFSLIGYLFHYVTLSVILSSLSFSPSIISQCISIFISKTLNLSIWATHSPGTSWWWSGILFKEMRSLCQRFVISQYGKIYVLFLSYARLCITAIVADPLRFVCNDNTISWVTQVCIDGLKWMILNTKTVYR